MSPLILTLECLSVAVVMVLILLPLLRRSVPRNQVFGFRTAYSLKTDENWYEVNEYFAKRGITWSLFLAGVSCATGIAVLSGVWSTTSVLTLGVPVFFVIMPVIETLLFIKRH